MPPVRILQAIGGTDFSWAPGEIVSMTDDQVAVWCDGERAELATDVVIDQAAIDEAVSRAVEGAGHVAEQLRLAELEQRQYEARDVVADNLPDGTDAGLAEELRVLAAELVAGVDPVRAAELAVAVKLGEGIGATLVLPEDADDSAAAGDGAAASEEEGTVPASEHSPTPQGGDSTVAPQEAREAKVRPERAARKSRAGAGRAEPGPETRG